MKEERSLLRDAIGTTQSKKENKGRKYVRIALTVIQPLPGGLKQLYA